VLPASCWLQLLPLLVVLVVLAQASTLTCPQGLAPQVSMLGLTSKQSGWLALLWLAVLCSCAGSSSQPHCLHAFVCCSHHPLCLISWSHYPLPPCCPCSGLRSTVCVGGPPPPGSPCSRCACCIAFQQHPTAACSFFHPQYAGLPAVNSRIPVACLAHPQAASQHNERPAGPPSSHCSSQHGC